MFILKFLRITIAITTNLKYNINKKSVVIEVNGNIFFKELLNFITSQFLLIFIYKVLRKIYLKCKGD